MKTNISQHKKKIGINIRSIKVKNTNTGCFNKVLPLYNPRASIWNFK